MKRKLAITLLSVVVIITMLTAGSLQREASKHSKDDSSPQGTWKLELFKYSNRTSDFNNRPASQPRIKLITDTHFTWVTIDTATGRIWEAAGGTYSLKGDTYIESMDYSYNMDSYLGTKSVYTIKVEENILFLSGELSRYGKIEEIWQRVK